MVRVEYFYKLPDGTYVDTEGEIGALVKVGERLGKPIYTKPELVPEPIPLVALPSPIEAVPVPVVAPLPPEPVPIKRYTPEVWGIITPSAQEELKKKYAVEIVPAPRPPLEARRYTREAWAMVAPSVQEELKRRYSIQIVERYELPAAPKEVRRYTEEAWEAVAPSVQREMAERYDIQFVEPPPPPPAPPTPPAVMTEIIEEIVPSGGIGEARIITTRVTLPTGEVEEKVRTVTYVPKYYDPTTDKEVAAPKPDVKYAVGTIKVTKSEWEETPEVTKLELRSEYDIEIRPDVPKVKEAVVVHIKPKQFLETEESYQRRLSAKEGYIVAKQAGDVKAAELFGKEMRTARQTLYGVTSEKYEEAAKVATDELTKRFLLGMAGAAKGIEITLERPLKTVLVDVPLAIVGDPLKFITGIPAAPRKFVSSIGVAFGLPPIPEAVPPKFISEIPVVGVKFAPIPVISAPSGLVTEAMERTIGEWAPRTAFDPSLEMEPWLRGLAIAGEVAGTILVSTATLRLMKKGVEVVEKALKTLKIDTKTGIGRAARKAVAKTKTAVKSAEKAKKKKVKTIKITKKMIEEGLPMEETGISERVPYTIEEIKTLMKFDLPEAKRLLADIKKTTRAGYSEMLELKEFAKAEMYRRGLIAIEELIKIAKVKPPFVEPSLIAGMEPTIVKVAPSVTTKVSALVAGITISRVGELTKSKVSTKESPAVTTMLKTTLIPRLKVAEKVKVITVQKEIQLQREAQAEEQRRRQLLLLGVTQLQKTSTAVTTILKEKVKEEEIIIPYEPTPSPPYEPTPPYEPPYEPPVTPPYEPTPEPPYKPTKAPPKKPPKKLPRVPGLPFWLLPGRRIIRKRVPIREALKPKGEYAPSITAVYERIIVRKPLKQTIFSPFDIRPIVTKKEKEEERKRRKRLAARAKVRDILKPSIKFGVKAPKKVVRDELKASIKFGVKGRKKGGVREALKASIKF